MIDMIGNAHLDPVWLWTKLDGFCEVVSTMESAVQRLEEEKDFIFNCSSAAYYSFIKEIKPELFKKIKKYVKEGRWNIVGGQWIQPDCNFPSGEIYARHALYSQRFYRENFGVTCKTGYCVDSFGHNGNLPQLLRQSGMENYVFMRPNLIENPNLPALFAWYSPDGSSVLAYRITEQNYNNSGSDLKTDLDKNVENAEKFGHDMMCFYGVGNHGGGPTRALIRQIKELMAEGYDIRFGSVDGYFARMRAESKNIGEHRGDLQHHAIGCYSVSGFIKRLERAAERELSKAERLSVMAERLLGIPCGQERFEHAYKEVLFNTFHDIMGGCSIRKGLEDAADSYRGAIAAARKIKEFYMIAVSKNIDTMIDGVTLKGKKDWQLWEEDDLGVPLVIFNTESYPVKRHITVERTFGSCANERGEALDLQYVHGSCMNGTEEHGTMFEAEVPAFGYTTYWLYQNRVLKPISEDGGIASACALENEFIRATFDKNSGALVSLYDKENGQEFLAGGSFVPRVYADPSDTWAHQFVTSYDLSAYETMRFDEMRITENGPLLGQIRIRYTYRNSYIYLFYNLYRGARKLEVKTKIGYSEGSSFIRLHLRTAFRAGRCDFETPFGFVQKEQSANEQPVLRYALAYDAADEQKALAVVTDYKSSFRIEGNDFSFVALRNSIFANHGGLPKDGTAYDYTDEGVTEFTFCIVPFSCGAEHAALVRAADELFETDFLVDSYHRGKLGRTNSNMSVSAPNVVMSAVKTAEDGDGKVIRLYETDQKKTDCEIAFGGRKFRADFRPNEVKTLRLRKDGSVEESNFLED